MAAHVQLVGGERVPQRLGFIVCYMPAVALKIRYVLLDGGGYEGKAGQVLEARNVAVRLARQRLHHTPAPCHA